MEDSLADLGASWLRVLAGYLTCVRRRWIRIPSTITNSTPAAIWIINVLFNFAPSFLKIDGCSMSIKHGLERLHHQYHRRAQNDHKKRREYE
jgi:hypothetical protein